jgi:hypothetical protein
LLNSWRFRGLKRSDFAASGAYYEPLTANYVLEWVSSAEDDDPLRPFLTTLPEPFRNVLAAALFKLGWGIPSAVNADVRVGVD